MLNYFYILVYTLEMFFKSIHYNNCLSKVYFDFIAIQKFK